MPFSTKRKWRISYLTLLTAVFLLSCISVVALWNAVGLRKAIERSTQSYLDDVSQQTAQLVDTRLNGTNKDLRLIADSTVRLDRGEWPSFLRRKALIADFKDIGIVELDGTVSFLDGTQASFADVPAFTFACRGEASAFLEDDHIFYLTPLMEGRKVVGVLAGVKTQELMQELISNESFDGQGSTSILDSKGEMLVSPVQRAFSHLIQESDYQKEEPWARQMLADLAAGEAGSITMPTRSGREIMIDYRPLSISGWFAATAVPKDILSAETAAYTTRTFYVIVGLVSIFFALMLAIVFMQMRYRAKLEAAAFQDSLTGGRSAVRFRMEAEELLRYSPPGSYALVSLNLKNFKLFNEEEGSRQGDELLCSVYEFLSGKAAPPYEIVARSSADHFFMLLKVSQPEYLRSRLIDMAKELETLGSPLWPMYVEQGVYIVEEQSIDLITCQDRANLARVSVREPHRSTCVFYDSQVRKKQQEEAYAVSRLEEAFQKEELVAYLQPKITLSDESIGGAEVLARWDHPQKGIIGPGAFIDLCEENDLISRLDLYMFERACRWQAKRREKGLHPVPASVNLSRQHLKEPDFLEDYVRLLEQYQLPANWFELEITESTLFTSPEVAQVRQIIERIHEIGFTCSMDDFGSGYSALGLLQELPLDCLKLDRQFFFGEFASPRTQAVITTVIELSQKLGMETVAEGVEREDQVRFLKKTGCDKVQGYYFSKPLSVEEFDKRYP